MPQRHRAPHPVPHDDLCPLHHLRILRYGARLFTVNHSLERGYTAVSSATWRNNSLLPLHSTRLPLSIGLLPSPAFPGTVFLHVGARLHIQLSCIQSGVHTGLGSLVHVAQCLKRYITLYESILVPQGANISTSSVTCSAPLYRLVFPSVLIIKAFPLSHLHAVVAEDKRFNGTCLFLKLVWCYTTANTSHFQQSLQRQNTGSLHIR